MNNENSFIIVLPSNTPSSIGNTPSKYLTTYDDPFQLNGEWEIGLLEMTFRNTIKTITEDDEINVNTTKIAQLSPITGEFRTLIEGVPFRLKDEYSKVIQTTNNEPIKWLWRINISPHEEELPILKSVENEFSIILGRDNYIYIVNNTKETFDISIPNYLAMDFGFKQHGYSTPFIYDANERLLLKSIKPGSNRAPYKIKVIDDEGGSKRVYTSYVSDAFVVDGKVTRSNAQEPIPYSIFKKKPVVEKLHTSKPNPGTYSDGESLARALREDSTLSNSFEFYYDVNLNRFEILSKNADHFLTLSKGIADVLGYSSVRIQPKVNERVKANMEADLQRGITSIYVYCDLCENIRVGHMQAPLLRNVAYNARKYGEVINLTYNTPYYIPVAKTHIDTIEVALYDSIGQLVPLEEGLTTCVLHFRRL